MSTKVKAFAKLPTKNSKRPQDIIKKFQSGEISPNVVTLQAFWNPKYFFLFLVCLKRECVCVFSGSEKNGKICSFERPLTAVRSRGGNYRNEILCSVVDLIKLLPEEI